MFKKALLAGVLGVFLASGAAMAQCQDCCCVNNPETIEFGYNIKVDLDVCLDWGNLNDDFWSAQANIYQEGDGNIAGISQTDTSDLAGIVQIGYSNSGGISQSGSNEYALIGQFGSNNYASIYQTLNGAAAVIIQNGNGNSATVNQ